MQSKSGVGRSEEYRLPFRQLPGSLKAMIRIRHMTGAGLAQLRMGRSILEDTRSDVATA